MLRTDAMEERRSWEPNNCSTSQKIPTFCETVKFIAVFRWTCHRFHINIILRSEHMFSGFIPKHLPLFLVSAIAATYPNHFTLRDLTFKLGWKQKVGRAY